jgi:hypothetical protein
VRRLLIPIIAALVLALGLGLLIGGTVASTAVTVNGQSVSNSQLSSELDAVAASTPYRCYLNASALVRSNGSSQQGPIHGATPASYSMDYVANWLDQDITNMIIRQAADAQGLGSPSAAWLAAAKDDLLGSIDSTLSEVSGTQAECSGTASQILATMPASFVTSQVEAQALSEALLVKHGGLAVDPAAVAAYYAAHQSDFDTYCVSGIVSTDSSVYQKFTAGLAAGTSFAELATQLSQDQTSAARGGVLGCYSPGSAGYTGLVNDVKDLAVGTPSGPISVSSTSTLILLVTSRTPTPLSSITNDVRRTIIAKDAVASASVASTLVRSAHVLLNPRYGSWSSSRALSGVRPPPTPAASSLLNAASIAAGATGS